MDKLVTWWKSGLSPWVKFVYLVLLANAVPAFLVLQSLPDQTENWFVWTVKPEINARLLGAMYLSALLLVLIGFFQTTWARARITLVVIAPFSIAATIVTFFHLALFLQHPWYHLTYWLTMYIILFFAAPVVFIWQERKHGGKLETEVPLSTLARATAVLGLLVSAPTALGLFIDPTIVNNFWPWSLAPLVGRIIGVWFLTMAIAYGWTLWDGDWLRTRPLFWQAIPCGLLLALLPLLHSEQIGKNRGSAPLLDTTSALVLYLGLSLTPAVLSLVVVLLSQRRQLRPNPVPDNWA